MRNILFLAILINCCLLLGSCTKGYEEIPLGQQTPTEYVFNPLDSAGVSAKQYQLNMFLRVFNIDPHGRFGGGNYLDGATDDALPSAASLTTAGYRLLTGSYSALSTVEDIWASSYAAIRNT